MEKRTIGILMACVCLCACGGKKQQSGKEAGGFAIPVNVAVARSEDLYTYVEATGVCAASVSVDCNPQVVGTLASVGFKDGQDVKQGDVLFKIDDRIYKADLDSARATLERDRSQLKLYELKLQRSAQLAEKQFISQQDLDSDKANVEMQRAIVAADQAAVERAQVNYEHCTIVSPIDGVIGASQLDAGNVIADAWAGKALATVNSVDTINIKVAISEQDFNIFMSAYGNAPVKAEVSLLGDTNVHATGTLIFRDNQIADVTGMLNVKVELENQARQFWPGQGVRVKLFLHPQVGAVVVPYSAMQMSQNGPFVYAVQEGNVVALKPIKMGQRYGENLHVVEGVQVGEQVVVTKQLMLRPGIKVAILPNGSAK